MRLASKHMKGSVIWASAILGALAWLQFIVLVVAFLAGERGEPVPWKPAAFWPLLYAGVYVWSNLVAAYPHKFAWPTEQRYAGRHRFWAGVLIVLVPALVNVYAAVCLVLALTGNSLVGVV